MLDTTRPRPRDVGVVVIVDDVSRYLRVAALGDSITFGIGDRVPGGYRGWLRLLVEALESSSYDVSCHVTARPGATTAHVRTLQLAHAVAHRPDLATLVVGVNDVLRAGWDAARTRDDLMACADALAGTGARLLTVRYHDLPASIGLPRRVRRPLAARLDAVNGAVDDVHAAYGGLCLDLAERHEVLDRACWSLDRLHPSELGHRTLARAFAGLLVDAGYDVVAPSLTCGGGLPHTWRSGARWVLADGGPWMGRRVRELGPWAAQLAWAEMHSHDRAPLGSSA